MSMISQSTSFHRHDRPTNRLRSCMQISCIDWAIGEVSTKARERERESHFNRLINSFSLLRQNYPRERIHIRRFQTVPAGRLQQHDPVTGGHPASYAQLGHLLRQQRERGNTLRHYIDVTFKTMWPFFETASVAMTTPTCYLIELPTSAPTTTTTAKTNFVTPLQSVNKRGDGRL